MLSNAIWMMPTADRAAQPGTATIYYRCGSQAGRAARSVSDGLSETEFTDLTAAFVAAEIEVYRRAQASRQKNSARNLKKYFDAAQIAVIERGGAKESTDLARAVL